MFFALVELISSHRITLTTAKLPVIIVPEPEIKPPPVTRATFLPSIMDNKENKELSTALRRRRDRFARQATHIQQQELLNNSSNTLYNGVYGSANGIATNGSYINGTYSSKPYLTLNTVNLGINHYANGVNGINEMNGIIGGNGIIGLNAANVANGINSANGQQNEEESEKLTNRTAKSLILPDNIIKNGLFVL